MMNAERKLPLRKQVEKLVQPQIAEAHPINPMVQAMVTDVVTMTYGLQSVEDRQVRQAIVDTEFDLPFADYLKSYQGSLLELARAKGIAEEQVVYQAGTLTVPPLPSETIGRRELQIRVSTLPKFGQVTYPPVEEDEVVPPRPPEEIAVHPDMEKATALFDAAMTDPKLAKAAQKLS